MGLGAVLWTKVHRHTFHDALSRAVWATSFGHLGLQGAGQIEVPPDGIVVGASTKGHKEVPDGVSKGDRPVTLEEHHAQTVEDPSGQQLPDALGVGLSASTRVGHRSGEPPAGLGAPRHSPPPQNEKRRGWGARPDSRVAGLDTCCLFSPN